jgi:hypothetical protein
MQAEEIRFEIERRHRNRKTIGLEITGASGVTPAIFTILNYFHAK